MTQVKRNQLDTDIINGWIAANEAWTYASADAPTFVITVPSGAASKYNGGGTLYIDGASTTTAVNAVCAYL